MNTLTRHTSLPHRQLTPVLATQWDGTPGHARYLIDLFDTPIAHGWEARIAPDYYGNPAILAGHPDHYYQIVTPYEAWIILEPADEPDSIRIAGHLWFIKNYTNNFHTDEASWRTTPTSTNTERIIYP